MAITCCHFRLDPHVPPWNLRMFREFANEIPSNSPLSLLVKSLSKILLDIGRGKRFQVSTCSAVASLAARRLSPAATEERKDQGDPVGTALRGIRRGTADFFSPSEFMETYGNQNLVHFVEIWDEAGETNVKTQFQAKLVVTNMFNQ